MYRILASGIRNPGTSGVHLKESAIRLTIKTGIQVLLTKYRPWHGIQNPRLSWISIYGATLSYVYISAVHAKDKSLKDFKETRVVVVGGGYGGIAAAKKLKDNCKLTLIDARDAFHHNMGAQRSSVEAGALRVFL